MSSKINVIEIISGHIQSLKTSAGSTLCFADFFTFYGVPIGFSITGILFDYNLSENITNIFVNFGSIFTALLLSVLVLVYDQENKLDDKKEMLERENKLNNTYDQVPFYGVKKVILNQLYYSICYCVVASMVLVFVATINSIIDAAEASKMIGEFKFSFDINTDLLTPISIFLAVNVILTILMVVKRMHALLTTNA
ncbi:hypothetical protein [Methylomonas sp. UP202]|uniref:hypothetical protein n=1 Tax=Methylomonas sp. UP202 TaxID=3040943 RepID=UPI002478A888|nr:hypothetical protein [Methylomonas sp. UP202]WGS86695.1 hypothetical protein QC632_02790 [Methylomonas sp. UP202]